MTSIDSGATTKPKPPLIYNPKVRGIAYQAVLCITIAFLAWAAVHNAAENLARAKIASGEIKVHDYMTDNACPVQ